jgi:hypothetical protein
MTASFIENASGTKVGTGVICCGVADLTPATHTWVAHNLVSYTDDGVGKAILYPDVPALSNSNEWIICGTGGTGSGTASRMAFTQTDQNTTTAVTCENRGTGGGGSDITYLSWAIVSGPDIDYTDIAA